MNKEIKQTNERKFRFNVVDLVILLAVILCILGALWRSGVVTNTETQVLQNATVSFYVENIQGASADYFTDGADVYAVPWGYNVGKIIGESINILPAEKYNDTDDGRVVFSNSSTGRIDVRGSFSCTGILSQTEGFLLFGTQYIAPGLELDVKLPLLDVTILITDIVVEG